MIQPDAHRCAITPRRDSRRVGSGFWVHLGAGGVGGLTRTQAHGCRCSLRLPRRVVRWQLRLQGAWRTVAAATAVPSGRAVGLSPLVVTLLGFKAVTVEAGELTADLVRVQSLRRNLGAQLALSRGVEGFGPGSGGSVCLRSSRPCLGLRGLDEAPVILQAG